MVNILNLYAKWQKEVITGLIKENLQTYRGVEKDGVFYFTTDGYTLKRIPTKYLFVQLPKEEDRFSTLAEMLPPLEEKNTPAALSEFYVLEKRTLLKCESVEIPNNFVWINKKLLEKTFGKIEDINLFIGGELDPVLVKSGSVVLGMILPVRIPKK